MNDFGFKLSPSSAVYLDKLDNSKFEELAKVEPDVLKCMACGSCSATCTAGQFYDVSLRRIITYLQRGRDEEAVTMVSHCMLCGKCSMVCPRGINTRRLILSISRIYNNGKK